MNRKLVSVLLASVLLLALGSQAAWAIPAFARKYQTSCQTCHIAYPKLNSYGEAFRLLGYHLPGETEEQIKQPDVPLGSDAYKRVWPKAVWPGAIPPQIPLALVTNFLVENSSSVEGEDVDNDFLFPQSVELVAGGSAGKHISFFGEISVEQEIEGGESTWQVSVDHIDLRLIRPIGDSTAFNVKIGSFQPEMVSIFDHARRLTVANYDSMFGVATSNLGGAEEVGGGGHHGAEGSIALPAVVEGFELFGVATGRLQWSAGVANGLGPGDITADGNSNKDIFANIGYKWGGLALDGSNAETYAGSSKNWREKSLRVGLLFYRGDGSGIFTGVEEHHDDEGDEHEEAEPHVGGHVASFSQGDDDHDEEGEHDEEPHEELEPAFLENDKFIRYGVTFNWFFKDLNLFGAFVRGEDDLFAFAADEHGDVGELIPDESGTFEYDAWFLEADVVLGYPWLHGAFRYESVDLPKSVEDWERATVSFTGLIRANVKATLEYTWDLNETGNNVVWVNFGLAL